MLDQETKRRIDTLRDILVGKLPSPESQVEQITTGLIYKFMYDMDQESIDMGGVASFFTGDFEKYSWDKLFDARLGGADKVKLYSDAIEKMYTNANAPQLFRDIFKNSFLPFKDPNTLNMFIDEVNKFHYSHSEKLGDAFEYLLSFMGSQGDAGQFRTPRHIIDFIVEIVNPEKDETILDPACGTSGFLISSFKHILKQNTDKTLGDKLNSNDRKKMGDNLVGYDISPDMTRISLVNMYLNEFVNPLIHEYDTLSSEDKWNEYFDVILANPPFFSPKGGIQPHSRFGVKSNRAEVLFVDYIMEHLKPKGRAGIIVPEGIIFQTGKAYKTLRKKLVEDCLVGVISLPAGVFQPYSGVKTSILILDKELNQKSDSIFFAKVENDGFSLGAQRTAIQNNDIPYITQQIQSFFEGKENSLLFATKNQIQAKDFKLSKGEYEVTQEIKSNFDIVELGDVLVGKPIYGSGAKKSEFDGEVRYLRITDITNDGRLKVHDPVSPNAIEPEYFLDFDDFLIARSGSVGRCYLHKQTTITCQFAGYLIKFPLDKTKVNPNYFLYITKSKQFTDWISRKKKDGTISNINAKEYSQFNFPLPPIEVQQQIVDELEGYQNIIDGCRQVVENYKPTIDIDPLWEWHKLEHEIDFISGVTLSVNKEKDENGVPIITMAEIKEDGSLDLSKIRKVNTGKKSYRLLEKGDLLFNWRNGSTRLVGKTAYFDLEGDFIFASFCLGIRAKSRFNSRFLWVLLNQFRREGVYETYMRQSINGLFNREELKVLDVPIPPLAAQEEIVRSIEDEMNLLEGNKRLMEIYTQKIQDRISKVWGE